MHLDLKLLLLGAVPPLLAIVAEVANPVRGERGASDTEDAVRALIPDRRQGADVLAWERNQAGKVIARTVDGAVEVSGIVPTWISVTAGVAGITSESLSLTAAATITAVIAVFVGVIMPYVFATGWLDYYRLAESTRCILLAKTKRECLSRVLIGANLVVVVLAVVAALAVHSPGRGG